MRSTFKPSAPGFSLIELLVGITLGILLIGGVIQVYLGSKTTFNTNQALARVQENGRFVLDKLKEELQPVGDNGFCGGDLRVRNHLNADCDNFTEIIFGASEIIGYDFNGTGRGADFPLPADLTPVAGSQWRSSPNDGLPAALAGRVVPGSDVLVFRRAEVIPGVTADGNTPANAASITLNKSHNLPPNSIVFITNCASGADLFQNIQGGGGGGSPQANSLSRGNGACSNPGPGNIGLNWSTAYGNSMQIFRQRVLAYYIGLNPAGAPGLFRQELFVGDSAPPPQELASGVETMQVLYGFSRTPFGAGQAVDDWITADEIPNAEGWQNVIAVKIEVSARAEEPVGDVERELELAETTITFPDDGRLRQPMPVTVMLRNRPVIL